MPKVKAFNIEIAGIYKNMDIWFTEGKGFHLKSFPEKILEVIGEHVESLSNDTLKGLENKIYRIKEEYEKAIKTKHKVIFVRVNISQETFERIGVKDIRHHDNSVSCTEKEEYSKFNDDFSHRIDGYGFSINYRIGYQYITGAQTKYTSCIENYEGIVNEFKHNIKESEIILDWTEEREQYL